MWMFYAKWCLVVTMVSGEVQVIELGGDKPGCEAAAISKAHETGVVSVSCSKRYVSPFGPTDK